MPVYKYACNRCDGRIEVKQSFNDAPLKEHDGCGGELRRLLSVPGIVFKGSGWYVTDSRSTPSESSSSSSGSKSEKAA